MAYEERQRKEHPDENRRESRSVRSELPPYGSDAAHPVVPASPEAPVWPTGARVALSVSDGLYVAERDGEILLANPALARLVGAHGPSDLEGRSLNEFIAPSERRRHPLRSGSLLFRRLDGRDVAVEHIDLGLVSDMSARRAGLVRESDPLRLAAVGEKTVGILHDLRNVLTGVVGYADQLAGEWEAERRFRSMLELATLGTEIAGQIVDFAAARNGAPGPASLGQAVRDTVDQFTTRFPANVSITFDLHDIPPVAVEPVQLRRLVMNLAFNAANAMKMTGGSLRFVTRVQEATPTLPAPRGAELRRRGLYAVLEVHDSGPGMSPALTRRIFDPFVTESGGHGLGLAIVREILRRCEGGVEVHSEIGRGTTFRVYLPIHAPEA